MRVSTAKTATVLMTEDVPVEAELIKLHLRDRSPVLSLLHLARDAHRKRRP
jgi:hypothetical protein